MVVTVVVAAMLVGGLVPGLSPRGSSVAAPGRPLFVVITSRGDVRDGTGRALKVGDQVAAGATVRTGAAGRLIMVTRTGSGFVLDKRSELTVARNGKSAVLRTGRLFCRNWKHEFAAITTAAGKIRLLGTAIDAAMQGKDKTAVTVVDGQVKLENSHGAATVPAGHRAMLLAYAAPDAGDEADVPEETAWIEGTLYWRMVEHCGAGWGTDLIVQALTGGIETDESMPSADADPSPLGDQEEIVWSDDGFRPPSKPGSTMQTEQDIFIQKPDGTIVNLTGNIELGGKNCSPKWSPDGTMIAFQHCDATGDRPPCKDGFHVWLMNADGSGAHSLFPEGTPPTRAPRWAPDGQHLLVKVGDRNAMRWADLTGRLGEELPDQVEEVLWSPDANRLIGAALVAGTKDGQEGAWRKLVLMDAAGGNPRVLVQRFVADADITPHYPTDEQLRYSPQFDWIGDVRYWVGPMTPQWSPDGSQIAFLAALPFDPAGPYYREQDQVWIYDLSADKLVQVTYGGSHYALVWRHSGAPIGGTPGGAVDDGSD